MSAAVKPEPGAPTPPKGNDGPKLSPIAAALARAREAQQASKQPAGELTDLPADETPEGEDNQHEEAEGDETDEAGGEEAEGEPEGAGEDESKQGEPKGGEPAKAEGEAEDVDEDLVVALPPRREGDDEFEIVVESKEAAERLRQLKNGYEAAGKLRAEREAVEQDRALIEEMEVWIGTDPAGFIIQNVPPETIEDVALSLVLEPAVFEKLSERLQQALEDPRERRVLQAELKAARASAQSGLRTAIETRRYAKEQGRIVRDAIARMVPVTDGITETRRTAIIQTLETAVAQTIREKKLEKIEVDDVPILLASQLRAAGIDPLHAAQLLKGKPASEPGARLAKKRKQPTRAELMQASQRRKRAAASTPPGGGAPASRTKLPAGQTLEERFKLAREKGLGVLLGR
jgi:hypothetical protein